MTKSRTWVLDTETKGTGAQMVPLDKVLKDPSSQNKPLFVPRKRRPRPEPEPAPKPPRRFKVVDVMTREVLAEDADGRALIDALTRVGSVVDVHISVWDHEDERWRLLTFAEQKAIWALRER
jgi:hypothetical protein